MKIIVVLGALSVCVALVLGALLFHVGEPTNPSWWIEALPFALWVIGPAAVPVLVARHRPRLWLSVAMLLYVVASSIFSGLVYYDAFFQSKGSTAALVLVFIPLYQWTALILLLLLCLGVSAWLTQRRKAA